MLAERTGEALVVPRRQQIEQRVMARRGLYQRPTVPRLPQLLAMRMQDAAHQYLLQRAQPRETEYFQMERGVELNQPVFVAIFRGRRHLIAQPIQPLERGGIDRRGGARGGA